VSGAKAARLQLDLMLDNLRAGDVLVIWKLDRLGRSLQHLVELVQGLMEKGVGGVSPSWGRAPRLGRSYRIVG
jgi:DNA invertase Pin-like site-specific DNA recombinase